MGREYVGIVIFANAAKPRFRPSYGPGFAIAGDIVHAANRRDEK